MLLTIDCGNTNTVFSIWDGEKFLCTLRTAAECIERSFHLPHADTPMSGAAKVQCVRNLRMTV